ncbi:MAG: hypothetical protein M1822_007044 [Bathelium mastoideum]|nr:MAG: hypothetical protein M1822_007044 [Bathelium mastoideum]
MAPFFFPRDRNDFDVAIICALQIESDAVEAMFDEIWEGQNDFGKATNDQNTYTTGRIGSHNVVLAYMPGMGKVASASVAISSLHSFPNITLGLVVGICAAIPKSKTKEEIILGDVVISTGVEQFDFGRRLTTGFKAKNTVGDRLGRSTPQIRSFLKKLGGRHWLKILGEDTVKYLQNLHQEEGFEAWHYPGVQADNLYPPDYLHKHKIGTCTCHEDDSTICDEARDVICAELQCDKEQAIQRSRLQDFAAMWGAPGTEMGPTPLIHFGPIASGDQTIRDATYRDQLARQNGVIAFEMEGAGAWDNFPTVVIKGVCDYADSHKNKTWHPYAAAVAAACMKAFLKQWNVSGFRELTPSSTLEPEVKIELAPVPEPPLIPQNHLLIETFRQYGTRSIPEIQWDLLIRAALYIIAVFALILPWMPDGRIKSDLTMHQTQELHPEYPIFAVIGKTGVGKSSFINVLGGRNYSADAPEICHGLETCKFEQIEKAYI